jgi:hypothetical protein
MPAFIPIGIYRFLKKCNETDKEEQPAARPFVP